MSISCLAAHAKGDHRVSSCGPTKICHLRLKDVALGGITFRLCEIGADKLLETKTLHGVRLHSVTKLVERNEQSFGSLAGEAPVDQGMFSKERPAYRLSPHRPNYLFLSSPARLSRTEYNGKPQLLDQTIHTKYY